MSDTRPILVFATRNPGKLVELRQMFAGTALQVRSLDEIAQDLPEVVEDGDTFTANAIKKAREVSSALGLPALADDSGLEVDALDGAPGVYSARYAGEEATTADNNRKLLAALREIPEDRRGARFRSVLAFVDATGALADGHYTTAGVCEGHILTAEQGTGGFGYDPLFFSRDLQVSFAEAGQRKHLVSHRGRAMAAMKPFLLDYFRLANPDISG